jgi:hypothetical protein
MHQVSHSNRTAVYIRNVLELDAREIAVHVGDCDGGEFAHTLRERRTRSSRANACSQRSEDGRNWRVPVVRPGRPGPLTEFRRRLS